MEYYSVVVSALFWASKAHFEASFQLCRLIYVLEKPKFAQIRHSEGIFEQYFRVQNRFGTFESFFRVVDKLLAHFLASKGRISAPYSARKIVNTQTSQVKIIGGILRGPFRPFSESLNPLSG